MNRTQLKILRDEWVSDRAHWGKQRITSELESLDACRSTPELLSRRLSYLGWRQLPNSSVTASAETAQDRPSNNGGSYRPATR